MSQEFENRQKAYENNFALKEEQEFKARVVAAKQFGLWAASEMKLSNDEASNYSKKIIDISILDKEHQAIINEIYKDFIEKHIECTKAKLELTYQEKISEARIKVTN